MQTLEDISVYAAPVLSRIAFQDEILWRGRGAHAKSVDMDHLKCRPATLDDADSIAKVHVDVWRSTYKGIVPDKILDGLKYEVRAAQHRERITKADPRQCTLVIEASNEITGFINVGPRRDGREEYDGELYAIYLLDKFHGQGIGRRLFLSGVEWLKTNGYKSMFLWVLKENATRKFYETMGGVILDTKTIEIGAKLEEISYGWPTLDKL